MQRLEHLIPHRAVRPQPPARYKVQRRASRHHTPERQCRSVNSHPDSPLRAVSKRNQVADQPATLPRANSSESGLRFWGIDAEPVVNARPGDRTIGAGWHNMIRSSARRLTCRPISEAANRNSTRWSRSETASRRLRLKPTQPQIGGQWRPGRWQGVARQRSAPSGETARLAGAGSQAARIAVNTRSSSSASEQTGLVGRAGGECSRASSARGGPRPGDHRQFAA